MKNERNLNIEMLRGLAILMMLFYHYIQSIPGLLPANLNATILNEAIGAVSLALFYTISGYGTYLLFESISDLKYIEFIKRRSMGIMPHYFMTWFITFLFIKPHAIGGYTLKDICAELLFVHNYNPEGATINGVTWTIALMMQFYLVAPFVYRVVKKWPYLSTIMFVLGSLFLARFLCGYVVKEELGGIWLVAVSMRWLPTNLGIFVLGMFAAKFKRKIGCSNKIKMISLFILLFFMIIGFYKLIYLVGGTYGDGYRFVIREPLMAACAAICLWLVSQLEFSYESFIGKIIQIIAKNQYGIYLWHMILFGCFSASPLYLQNYEKHPIILFGIIYILAIMVGIIFTKLVNSYEYKRVFKALLKIENKN